MRYCSIAKCTKKHNAKGLCVNHYQRLRNTGSAPTPNARKIVLEDTTGIIARYRRGESENSIAGSLNVSRNVITRIFNEQGVRRRNNADANRLMMLRRSPEENRRNARNSHIAARTRVHSWEEKAKRAASRERNPVVNVSPSEKVLLRQLSGYQLHVVPQKAIGIYNCDIAVGNVAIEVYGGGWHAQGAHRMRSTARFRYILSEGWNVAIVWVDVQRYPLAPAAAEYLAAYVKECVDSGMTGECRVLRGDGRESLRNPTNLEELSVKPSIL